jgi:hypothetical protein
MKKNTGLDFLSLANVRQEDALQLKYLREYAQYTLFNRQPKLGRISSKNNGVIMEEFT